MPSDCRSEAGPDAGQLQELRRVIGAAGQDHLLARTHVDGFAAAPAFGVAHADRALALEQKLGRMRVRAHGDVAALHRRVQERGRRAHAPPVVDGALRVGHAFLDGTVVVAVARNAEAHGACDEGLAQRITPVDVGDGQRPVAPAIGGVAVADAALQPLEVGQHVGIAPAAVAELRPGVEVIALAPIVDMAVDRRRAAERLAAWRENAAAGGALGRLLRIAPVDAGVVEGLDEARRDMDVGVPVGGTGFEHADACCRVFAEAVGEHTAGRARADDDVIERVHERML